MSEDDASVFGTCELGRHHKVILGYLQHLAAHDTCETAPAAERQDDADGKVDLDRGPAGWHGGAQGHPQRDRRNRDQELDDALDDRVDCATIVARDATQCDPQDKAC